MKQKEKKFPGFERFASRMAPDIFARCEDLWREVQDLNQDHLVEGVFSLPYHSGLDREVEVLNPWSKKKERWLCFDSNGYLGLQHHPAIKEAVIQTVNEAGAGTPSVPLLGGQSKWMRAVEDTVSRFHGREAALVFSSGYSANVGVVSGLSNRDDAIVIDESAHASLHHGARLSRSLELKPFRNNDMNHLEEILKNLRAKARVQGILIVTDGIFSMTGKVAPLPELNALAKKYEARLLIDEAHSVGVVGKEGRGIEEHFRQAADLVVGTFSKAFGFSGGYVTGPRSVIEFLRFGAPSWVFSTSMPSCQLAGIHTAIEIHLMEPEHLAKFRARRDQLWAALGKSGIEGPPAVGGIFPVVVNSNNRLVGAAKALAAKKIKCGAIAFPAVKRGQGMLRIVPTARHLPEDIDRLAEALSELKRDGKI